MSETTPGSGRGRYHCAYNDGVLCPPVGRRCESCGWNPEEQARRKEARTLCKKSDRRSLTT